MCGCGRCRRINYISAVPLPVVAGFVAVRQLLAPFGKAILRYGSPVACTVGDFDDFDFW